MRIVFMGTPEFAVRPLESLASSGYEVVTVCTQPDKTAGRGRALEEPLVKKSARKLNLPVLQPANLKSAEVKAQLAELKPDAIVVAAFGQILPRAILELPPYGCVNIHPSLLPRFRGVAPVPAAILSGDEFTGVSIMLMDKGVDTGPVLARAQIPILSTDTAGSLVEKLSLIGAQLLLDVLPRWFRKELKPQPQNDANATCTKMLAKEAGEIDWRLSAVELWRYARAYQPWPGCYTRWQGKQLKIVEAIPLADEGVAEPGRVVTVKESSAVFGVGTGNGVLGVMKVQLEGKRVMTADEFLRGQRQFIGAVLS
ncbi:MAG: methionyl-tRNA formyltransferase [Chloroflexi bacterium]|nr:methionyl-tRNA formyltransferase [Chloroflexota bacterium]